MRGLCTVDLGIMNDAIQKAIDAAGGLTALGDRLGVTKGVVWAWKNRGQVPAEHCPAIERATAGAVRCEELRPDVDWAYLRSPRRKAVA